MKKIIIIMTVLLLAFILACPSCAQRRGDWEKQSGDRARGMPGQGQFGDPTSVPDFLIIDLHLSDEQSAKITSVREGCLKDLKVMQQDVFSKRGELKLLWGEKNRDQEKMAVLQREIKNIKDQMQERIAGYVLQVRNILTADQDSLLRSYWPGLGGSKERRGGPAGDFTPGEGPGDMDGGRGTRGR